MSQTSHQPTALPNVLLLSESEALASLEKRALREAGVTQIHSQTSGIVAARMLAGLVPGNARLPLDCMVVCGQKLEDMDGEQFCALIRLHPRLLGLPILLILANDSELEQLRTLGCGASALLARPYTVPHLQEKLVALASGKNAMEELQQASQQASMQNFDKALATYGALLKPKRQPEDYFRVGMQCLQEHQWNTAISAFQRALQSQLIKGEAEMGMAAAWKGKGDLAQFHTWLARAADTFVRAERWHAARAAFGRLTQDSPDAKNPFVRRAREQILAGQFDAAADTLTQGFEVTPKEKLSRSWARICMAAPDPAVMLRKLETCLNGHVGADNAQIGQMSDAIREQVDNLLHEQALHRKEESARRQRELSRRLGVGKDAGDEESEQKGQDNGATRHTIGIEIREDAGSASEILAPFHTPKGAAAPLMLEDMSMGMDAGSGSGMLHDVFSVMKLTWQLSRKK